MKLLAILENMWGNSPGRLAPLFFSINPHNYTGGRLYRMTRGHDLLVTNAYCTVGGRASDKPGAHVEDRSRLARALDARPWDGVLVCGRPAQTAYKALHGPFSHFRVFMPHPASRSLTNALMAGVAVHLSTQPVRSVEFIQQRDGFTVACL